MPIVTTPPNPTRPAVSPIVGNRNIGSSLYDPTTFQSLYVTLTDATGAIDVHRTTGAWQDIVSISNSVAPGGVPNIISTVRGGGSEVFIRPTTAHLQRINGTIYCNLTGKTTFATTRRMGHWIYQDTSAAKDGTGPWTLYSTIQDLATGGSSDDHFFNPPSGYTANAYCGGEIIVNGSTWATGSPLWETFGSNTASEHGIYASLNGGLTWSRRVRVEFWIGGRYGERQSRSFGWHPTSGWWWGAIGNAGSAQHYSSTDGYTWTDQGSLGYDANSTGLTWPMSFDSGGAVYIYSDLSTAGAVLYKTLLDPTARTYDTPGIDLGSRGLDTDGYSSVQVWNAGPDDAPLWVAGNRGEILPLSGSGWTVGRIGIA